MKDYNDFYTKGQYLENNPSWDCEDSPWKAAQLFNLVKKNKLKDIGTLSEVGCGSGEVLYNLYKKFNSDKILCFGYDISPQAIEIANKLKTERGLDNFKYEVASIPTKKTGLLICADVFEHIDGELAFLRGIKDCSEYKIFNIPLDLSIQSLIREKTILDQRERVGHINYYTKSLALAVLKDAGYEIMDWQYAKWYKYYNNKSLSTKVMNLFRDIFMSFSPDLCVKFLGGSSIVVLSR